MEFHTFVNKDNLPPAQTPRIASVNANKIILTSAPSPAYSGRPSKRNCLMENEVVELAASDDDAASEKDSRQSVQGQHIGTALA